MMHFFFWWILVKIFGIENVNNQNNEFVLLDLINYQ